MRSPAFAAGDHVVGGGGWQQYAVVNNDYGYARAWGAALVLIAFVMGLNLIARGIARWRSRTSAITNTRRSSIFCSP